MISGLNRYHIFKQAKENEIETKKAVNKLLQDNMMKAKLEEKLKVGI